MVPSPLMRTRASSSSAGLLTPKDYSRRMPRATSLRTTEARRAPRTERHAALHRPIEAHTCAMRTPSSVRSTRRQPENATRKGDTRQAPPDPQQRPSRPPRGLASTNATARAAMTHAPSVNATRVGSSKKTDDASTTTTRSRGGPRRRRQKKGEALGGSDPRASTLAAPMGATSRRTCWINSRVARRTRSTDEHSTACHAMMQRQVVRRFDHSSESYAYRSRALASQLARASASKDISRAARTPNRHPELAQRPRRAAPSRGPRPAAYPHAAPPQASPRSADNSPAPARDIAHRPSYRTPGARACPQGAPSYRSRSTPEKDDEMRSSVPIRLLELELLSRARELDQSHVNRSGCRSA